MRRAPQDCQDHLAIAMRGAPSLNIREALLRALTDILNPDRFAAGMLIRAISMRHMAEITVVLSIGRVLRSEQIGPTGTRIDPIQAPLAQGMTIARFVLRVLLHVDSKTILVIQVPAHHHVHALLRQEILVRSEIRP